MTAAVDDRPRSTAITEDNRRWWTLGAMCFALFMTMLDTTVVNVALPSIKRDLAASLASLEWTVNAYALVYAVLLITGGRLGDIFGRRRLFLAGVVVFAISSAAVGASPSDTFLILGRGAQGVGAAMMMPATLAIITNAFPPSERGKAIGTWAGVSAMGLALGPPVGGFLTESVSWRAIFFINVPVAAVAVAVTLFATCESRDEEVARRIDYPGVVTITLALAAIVLALMEGNSWGWDSAGIVALFGLGAAALASFVAVELCALDPVLDFSLFRSRTFLGASIAAFGVSFAMVAFLFFTSLYMQNVLGYTPLGVGLRFLPATLVLVALGPIAGRLADKVGPRPLITLGLLLVASALLWESRLTVRSSYGYLLGGFLLLGVGIGFTMSPMSTAAMSAVARTKAGVASGVLAMSRMVGGAFGVAVLGALVAGARGDAASGALPADVIDAAHRAFVAAIGTGFEICAGLTVTAAVLSRLLVASRPGNRRDAPLEHTPLDDRTPEPVAA
jgi:EmrB/QacA subfamily drug resistance transporter